MTERTRKLLDDALDAVTLIGAFTADASFEDYVTDDLLKSAVERQFQVLGLVLRAIARHDAATATAIPDLEGFVELGQALTEHHDGTDDQHLWSLRETELPALASVLRHLRGPRP